MRAAWAPVGTAGVVPITGANAKRVLFGAISIRTGYRVVLERQHAGGADARAFFQELQRHYRRLRTIWLLLDRASAYTAAASQALAARLNIQTGLVAEKSARVRWINCGAS